MLHSKALGSLIIATLSSLAPSAATAIAPPPIYPHEYEGPYIACLPGIALPVEVGEKLESFGGTDTLHFAGGRLLVEAFLSDPVADADIVHFRGTLDVRGLGPVTRYELTSRNPNSREIGYVFDTGKPYFTGHYRALFRSPQFTGNDADTLLLTRVVTGVEAEAMCARGKK